VLKKCLMANRVALVAMWSVPAVIKNGG